MEIINTLDIDDTTACTDPRTHLRNLACLTAAARYSQHGVILAAKKPAPNSGRNLNYSASVTNYLALCDTAEKTDELLAKLMVQLEELEVNLLNSTNSPTNSGSNAKKFTTASKRVSNNF